MWESKYVDNLICDSQINTFEDKINYEIYIKIQLLHHREHSVLQSERPVH